MLDFEAGERLDLEDPAADGFKGVTLATEGEAPELARVVVAKDEELPGAADAWVPTWGRSP